MKNLPLIFVMAILLAGACKSPQPEGCFPKDKLPDYITPLTSFGQRAEFSLNGKKVFFVDKAGGEIWMVDVSQRKRSRFPTAPGVRRDMVITGSWRCRTAITFDMRSRTERDGDADRKR